MAAVHSILPPAPTDAVDEVLRAAGVRHVAHGDEDPVAAAQEAVDQGAQAVIGPFRSRDVAEALEVTSPTRVPLLAPVATWVGQLDGQLRMAGLRRADDADMIVLAGLVGEPEVERARQLAPLPIIAFDGIQGEAFPGQDVELALVYAPGEVGVAEARRAAEIVVAGKTLEGMRALGFDEHGDPLNPLVRFERYDA